MFAEGGGREKREREEELAKKMEWGKGIVQREEEEKRRREVEVLKGKTFARGVDDLEMNEEMRNEDRWNDPAAAFLSVSGLLCLVRVGVLLMVFV